MANVTADMIFPGDAAPGDVLSAKTFSAGTNYDKPGTMADNGSLGTITPTTTNQPIAAGYTSGGTVAGDANLVSGNIKAGTSIFGVSGDTDVVNTSTSTAPTAGEVLTGKEAFANGASVTGTMANNGALSYGPSTSNRTIPAGYTSGGTVSAVGGTATAADVLTGDTFSSSGGIDQTGTMPNNGSLGTITPNGNSQAIPAGYTSGGTIDAVTVKTASGSVTSSASGNTANFLTYGGGPTLTVSFATIPVPSGATKILSVTAWTVDGATPVPGPLNGTYNNIFATPDGYADGNTSTVLCRLSYYNSGNSTITNYNIIAGDALSISTSSIVLPATLQAGSLTTYYTVYYV